MESMLDGYLNFARGLSGEDSAITDMKSYLQDIVQKTPAPRPKLIGESGIKASIRPRAIERVIVNLISNAQKYGSMSRVSLQRDNSNIYVIVEDDGPGIPEGRRAEAFKAFQRLDTARNQNIDGVGLGLSIARDITQMHGGALRLDESNMGGLKATIRLPI